LAGIIDEAGKGLVVVVSKWDSVMDKDAFTRDALAPKSPTLLNLCHGTAYLYSSVTGQNVSKLFDLILEIQERRTQEVKTRQLNGLLQHTVAAHRQLA
jgi:GTP-binding protein